VVPEEGESQPDHLLTVFLLWPWRQPVLLPEVVPFRLAFSQPSQCIHRAAPVGFGELPSGVHCVGAKLRAFTD
jgi:hypothetical protein